MSSFDDRYGHRERALATLSVEMREVPMWRWMEGRSARGGAAALALALVSACASLPPISPFSVEGSRPERSLDISHGTRDYSSSAAWPAIDEQQAVGLDLSWRRPEGSLEWELGVIYAEGEGDGPPSIGAIERRVSESSAGLRYLFDPIGFLQPYVGGGLSLLYVWQELEPLGLSTLDDDDWDWGVYARGGLRAELYQGVHLGVELRALREEWVGSRSYDLDYALVALTAGALF